MSGKMPYEIEAKLLRTAEKKSFDLRVQKHQNRCKL